MSVCSELPALGSVSAKSPITLLTVALGVVDEEGAEEEEEEEVVDKVTKVSVRFDSPGALLELKFNTELQFKEDSRSLDSSTFHKALGKVEVTSVIDLSLSVLPVLAKEA